MDKLIIKDGEREVSTTDLPKAEKGEADRFDEFAMGVKKSYRPEWLESENTLFINKLNFVTKHFSETHKHVKNLKTTVYTDYKNALDN